jgi:hypothetical protein
MNTPPGRNTLDISATAADGDGQQCIAAPACTASNDPVANGSRPTSARTNDSRVDVVDVDVDVDALALAAASSSSQPASHTGFRRSAFDNLASASQYAFVCRIIDALKSLATTCANSPLAANRLEKRPLPQLTSSNVARGAVVAPAPRKNVIAISVSSSSPGNPAHANDRLHPFSYAAEMTSLWKSLVPDRCGSAYAPAAPFASRHRSKMASLVGYASRAQRAHRSDPAGNGVRHIGHASSAGVESFFVTGAFAKACSKISISSPLPPGADARGVRTETRREGFEGRGFTSAGRAARAASDCIGVAVVRRARTPLTKIRGDVSKPFIPRESV